MSAHRQKRLGYFLLFVGRKAMIMVNIISILSEYMSYPFVQYAFTAGILISLSASLLGVTLVLRRCSFIGDGLSHVSFGALAIASVLKISADMAIVMPITMLAAVILLKGGQNKKIKGDAAIAMLSVGALAAGYLVMNIFSASPNISGDVCSTLFGSTSILTLSEKDVLLCAIMSAAVLLLFIFMYNKIFAVTFDEAFATASGIRSEAYNVIIAVITAVIIVLAMNLAGSLLTSALIIFPALSAMRIFKSFKSVIIFSGVLAVLCSALGMIISMLASVPIGSMIVIVNIAAFAICSLIGKFI